MKSIAISGATGFVGKRMIAYNSKKFQQKILSLRSTRVDAINLTGIDAVVHLAGKAHDMGQVDDSVYFSINYELTKQLANKAKENGVQQFIYISSVKVYGDEVNGILNESSSCTPTDAYGASKLQAEQYLQSIETGLFKIAIIRPPLVYGPEVKGNMIRLLQLAAKKFPLPFGKINNARSMVFVDNLVELINTIIDKEASGVFIAGDRKPLSTDELIGLVRKSLGNKSGLISIPAGIRKLIQKIKPAFYTRLFGSFVIDNSNTNERLNFIPPYSTEEGVRQMVDWFKSSR
jgi:nucleoside-diphosphate-sugar epimerase